jgi:uncharacterized protein YndB with AHSA1/START domain
MRFPFVSLLLVVVAVNPVIAQEKTDRSAIETGPGRWVRVEASVKAPVGEVWRVFTTSQGAEEFFAQKANIRLAIGGPYEIQFDPRDEQSGTKGLKILSYAPEEMISFEWNAPTEFPEVRNGGTWVVVQMRPEGAARTHVTITHYGWKQGTEWDQAYVHFQHGWGDLISRLERRFTDGPIDWEKERMMYKEAKDEMRDSPATKIALAHAEAWSHHDWSTTRDLLAPNVHAVVTSTVANAGIAEFTGADKYMELKMKAARLIEPGSLEVLSAVGDDRNAMTLSRFKIALGPDGKLVTMVRASLYLIDENKKIIDERDQFVVLTKSRRGLQAR